MADALDAFVERRGFDAKDRGYLELLVAALGDLQLLDHCLANYPNGLSSRAAVKAMWNFRGTTFKLLTLSPEAMNASVRFMVVSHESGAGVDNRAQILQRILSPWGLSDAAARGRAEKQLMEIAGPHVSDEELIDRFLTLHKQFVKNRERPDSAEARQYLKKYPGRGVFAANRFGATPGSAAAFVESLYAAGAPKVVIENITYDSETGSGSPHADSMTVHLPQDAARRQRIFEVINEEGQPEDAPFTDRGESTAGLWWD